MKRKTLTLVLCLLATFALASIGFASWIIANPDLTVNGTQEGSFIVYDATETSISIDVTFADSKNQIIFGKPVGYVLNEKHWLTPEEDILEENLSVTIHFSVTNGSNAKNGLEYMVLVSAVDYAKISAAKEANLISYDASLFSEVKDEEGTLLGYGVKEDLTDGDSYTLTFTWGSAFGGKNPVTHYNAGGYQASAKTNLDALEALSGIIFKLTIQEKPVEESGE